MNRNQQRPPRQTATIPRNARKNDGLSHTIHMAAANPLLRAVFNVGDLVEKDGKQVLPEEGPFAWRLLDFVEIVEVHSPAGTRIENILHVAVAMDGTPVLCETSDRFIGLFSIEQLKPDKPTARPDLLLPR
jgi:hypothetical protein